MDVSLNALDLDTHRWQKLANGRDIFKLAYRWHFCCLNEDGTQAWLLGSSFEAAAVQAGPKLSNILHVDLRKLGLLGNKLTREARYEGGLLPASDSQPVSHLSAIGTDLARTFDTMPESGLGCDFIITAIPDGAAGGATNELHEHDLADAGTEPDVSGYSRPIHVHRFLLSARWPHFARLFSAQMTEFHTKRMHIPEPYSAVRAFLFYLYTDSITAAPEPIATGHGEKATSPQRPSLEDVAGMLVMSSIYDMPRLQQLCVARLGRQMDIEHAPLIFERASAAQETWLKRQAASFCMTNWGRIVRTDAFKSLSREAMLELCEEVDTEARVISVDELEAIGSSGYGRMGHRAMHKQGSKRGRANRHRGSEFEGGTFDEESMEVE